MAGRLAFMALVACLMAGPALADVESQVSITTDHVDKGISNSDGHAAFQAGLTWAPHSDEGLFFAIDGSTVDFNDGTDAELNFVAGHQWSLHDNLSLMAGASRTHYVGGPKGADLWEFAVATALDLESHQWEAELVYSPDDGGAGHAFYKRVGVTVPFGEHFALAPHIGHQTYQRKDVGGPDYWDWGLELSVALDAATVGIAYTDTDLTNEKGCLCGGRVGMFVTIAFH